MNINRAIDKHLLTQGSFASVFEYQRNIFHSEPTLRLLDQTKRNKQSTESQKFWKKKRFFGGCFFFFVSERPASFQIPADQLSCCTKKILIFFSQLVRLCKKNQKPKILETNQKLPTKNFPTIALRRIFISTNNKNRTI